MDLIPSLLGKSASAFVKFQVVACHPIQPEEEFVMPNYYCKHCGQRFTSLAMLEANRCIRHPDGPQNHHELYEAGEQTHYVCKYCGQKYFSIADMTANRCPHHPNGRGQGRHAPA